MEGQGQFLLIIRFWICGQIYLILLEIVLTHNLHLERLLASLALSQTFLLSSTTAFSEIFFGLPLFLVAFTLKYNALLGKLFLSFLNACFNLCTSSVYQVST